MCEPSASFSQAYENPDSSEYCIMSPKGGSVMTKSKLLGDRFPRSVLDRHSTVAVPKTGSPGKTVTLFAAPHPIANSFDSVAKYSTTTCSHGTSDQPTAADRKSTRLNSSHLVISY